MASNTEYATFKYRENAVQFAATKKKQGYNVRVVKRGKSYHVEYEK